MSNLSDFISAGEKLTLGSYTKSTITGASTSFSLSNSAFTAASTNNISVTAGARWSPDGTKCNFFGSNDAYYHTASTAWDVTTLTNVGNNFNMTGLSNVYGLAYNDDGTKMIFTDGTHIKVIAYDLTTGYDCRTADEANRTELDISGDVTSPRGITFYSSGTKMVITDAGTSNFYVYTLSTGYDISTAGSPTQVSQLSSDTYAIDFNDDGYWCLATRPFSTPKIELWQLSTAYDLSTASLDSSYTNTTYGETITIQWNESTYDEFYTYNWIDGDDLNSISLDKILKPDAVQSCTLDLSSGNTFVINDIYGFRNTILQTSNAPSSGSVGKYNVLLPVPDNSLDQVVIGDDFLEPSYNVDVDAYINAGITTNVHLHFTNDGKYMHLLDANGFYYRFTLPRPYDLLYFNDYYTQNTTRPPFDEQVDLDPDFAALTDPTYAYFRIFHFDNDGTFILAIEDNKIKKVTMPSAHNLGPAAGATVIQEFTPTSITAPSKAFMTPDGVYLYTFDTTNDKATNYKLSRPFDLTSASLHSTATTLDIRDSIKPQVMSTGEALIYNYDYPSGTAGVYARTMSTNHDLSTLSAETNVLNANYQVNLTLTPDDATLYINDDQSGQKFYTYQVKVVRPTITLDDNIYPTDDVQTVMHVNKATKFNLLTADGGTTVIAY